MLVCLDETSKQHVRETRTPVPTRPGETAKYDYEYERNGVSNLFMLCAPLEGWRHVKATDRRLADRHVLKREIDAWQKQRNEETVHVNWRFTTDDARIKLKSLYPSIQS